MSSHVCPCLLRYFFHNFFHDKNTFLLFFSVLTGHSHHIPHKVYWATRRPRLFPDFHFPVCCIWPFCSRSEGSPAVITGGMQQPFYFTKLIFFQKKLVPVKTFYFSFQTDVYTKFQRKQKINWETSSKFQSSTKWM